MLISKRLKSMAALLASVVVLSSPALAQEWPKKQPVKLVLPVNAGGATDALARILADFLQKRIGQAVVVENRPGASATIAANYVFNAAPDGYTLEFSANELETVGALRKDLPFKIDQFTYLIRAFEVQPLLLGSPSLKASNAQELVALMKASPGKVRYGSAGIGGVVHLASVLLESSAGVKGTHITHTGIAPVFQDMLAGNIEFTQTAPPFPEGLKVLGTFGSVRNPSYPNALTMKEAGFDNAVLDVWFGLYGPPKLPQAIAERLTAEVQAVLKDPEAIEKFGNSAKILPAANPLTGEAFRSSVVKAVADWTVVVEREKIKLPQ
jgi:tripartite-type tricarboxylate transporter receptor subunit TctC